MPDRREFTRMSVAALAGLLLPRRVLGQSAGDAGLRISGPQFGIASLDPALARDLPTQLIVRQLFRGLMKFDAALQPVPDLAETVTASVDATQFAFVLRDDAAFADGTPITSQSVAASLIRALHPATAAGTPGALAAVPYLQDIRGAAELLNGSAASLAGVIVENDRRLVIELTAPASTFLMRLAHVSTSIVDTGEAQAKLPMWWQSPNATGPYRIASYSDSEIQLEVNPRYGAASARIASLTFLTGAAAANPFNLFQQGQIDLVPVADENAARLAEDPASGIAATVYRTPTFATGYIALGNQQPPLDDVHLRRALQRLLSPTEVAEILFGGGVQPASGLIPPGMLGRDWPGAIVSPDFETARAEIAQSRYGSGAAVPPISMYAADIEPVEALRDIAMAELGLRIDAIAVNWNDFLDGLVRKRFPAYSLYWGADYPDPAAFLDILFRSDASDNYTGYRNLALDAILATARQESGIPRRAELYEAAQAELLNDGGVIPLYHDVAVSLARPDVHALTITSMGLLYLEDVDES